MIAFVALGGISFAHDPDDESQAHDTVSVPTGNDGNQISESERLTIQLITVVTVALVQPELLPVAALTTRLVVNEVSDAAEKITDALDGPNQKEVHPDPIPPTITSPEAKDKPDDGGPQSSALNAHIHAHQKYVEAKQGANMPAAHSGNQLTWECLWRYDIPGNAMHGTCGEWGWR